MKTYHRVTELGPVQLQRLRKDIVLNSLFVSDYHNRYGLKPKEVCGFFDGYVDWLLELCKEKYGTNESVSWNDFFDEFDTTENLLEWQYMVAAGECY